MKKSNNSNVGYKIAIINNIPANMVVQDTQLLGFAHSEDSDVVYLSPFQHPTRLVAVLDVTAVNNDTSTVTISQRHSRDMRHDANKLFSALRGYPTNVELDIGDLEGFCTSAGQI